ncbi:MAG: D-2-hydroxyacid dehydrogenase [Oceanospirillaceae bacterium]|nr:D-2-hydroxyacid dehydrogenase [Oceanospirillaceae bacterium]MDC1352609.1 D-2-hydroxyacid dehydrogenase [Oceanospirillaceae bacterium]
MQVVLLDAETLGPDDLDFSPLSAVNHDLCFHQSTQPDEVVKRLAHAQIVLVNKVVLDASCLDQLPQLKHIIVLATGVNNIDLAAAARLGISVQNCRAYGVESVAQHCLMLMLNLSTKMLNYRRAINNGDWSRSQQFCLLDYPVESLTGKTLGIVGYGDLGKGVADLARAFGMNILIASRVGQKPSAGRIPLEQMLPQVDILSLHCPLTKDTTNLIDWPQLCALPNTALVINCARGGIVNEVALLKALEEGQIAGAGIDVLAQEPPPKDHPLLALEQDNLIITPHTAWASRQARQTILNQAAENLLSLTTSPVFIRQL